MLRSLGVLRRAGATAFTPTKTLWNLRPAPPCPPPPPSLSPPPSLIWPRLLASPVLGKDPLRPLLRGDPFSAGRCAPSPSRLFSAAPPSAGEGRPPRPSRHFRAKDLKQTASSADAARARGEAEGSSSSTAAVERWAHRRGGAPDDDDGEGDADSGPSRSGRRDVRPASGSGIYGVGGGGGGGSYSPPASPPGFAERLSPLLARRSLFITRNIEWGALMLGWEQANRYGIKDVDANLIGFVAEESRRCSLRRAGPP